MPSRRRPECGLQLLDAEALDEVVRAFQVLRVLAVVLHEAAHVSEHLVVGVDGAEHVALAHLRAGGAADVDLPAAAFDRDRAESLVVASEQLRGQPAVASFILCGDSMPWKRCSIAMPRPVLSPTP